MSTVFGMMRVKNENMWIESVVRSMLPVCERIFILDDHSTDSTDEICRNIDSKVTVYHSEFEGLDESRDKNFLLNRIHNVVSDDYLKGDPNSPFWVLALDGDEMLEANASNKIHDIVSNTTFHSFAPQIMYLWDGPNRVRIDGVYANFFRPSLFRLFNKNFTFLKTPFGNGANFHCASVPQELLHCHKRIPVKVWHYGYMNPDHRKKKYEWYNHIDPNNQNEDCYRHIVQGDEGGPEWNERLKHAGPLEFKDVEEL